MATKKKNFGILERVLIFLAILFLFVWSWRFEAVANTLENVTGKPSDWFQASSKDVANLVIALGAVIAASLIFAVPIIVGVVLLVAGILISARLKETVGFND